MTKEKKKASATAKPRRAAKGRKPDASDAPDAIATGEGADRAKVAELDAKQALGTQCFTSSVEASVPPAGPLVEMPAAPSAAGPRLSLTPDEWRSLAGYASTFHDVKSQVVVFDAGDSSGPVRAPPGTRRLVKLGLVEERKAYFVTEFGAHVAKSRGIEVTRPVAKTAGAVAS